MTVARKTKRRNKIESVAIEAMSDSISMSVPDVARKYGVTRQSMHQFLYRHADEVQELKDKLVDRAETYQIEQKHYRLGEIQHLYGVAKAEIDLAETTQDKIVALKAASDRLRQAAEELGALPRPDQNINIKAAVLVRELKGSNPEEIG